MPRAGELPEKRRQVVDPRRSDPDLERGRPAARLTSAHSPLSPFSSLKPQPPLPLCSLAAEPSSQPPRPAAARLAGKTGHRPAHIPFRTVLHEQESKTRGRHPR